MYLEGGKYYFTHRSFQEYFCALFFSKQKETLLARLGDFFENLQIRSRGDQTFKMLYDMIPDKVETNILIPFLQNLFDECDNRDGYWTFLDRTYPHIYYEKGEVDSYSDNSPQSFLFGFVMDIIDPQFKYSCEDLPEDKALLVDQFGYIYEEEQVRTLIDISELHKYPWVEEEPEIVGWAYDFDVERIRAGRGHDDVLAMLDDDEFIFKSQYLAARRYLGTIREKQDTTDEFFLDLL